MEITKVTTVEVRTTDGDVLRNGDKVAYEAYNKGEFGYGIYNGLNKRGCIELINPLNLDTVMAIMPKSIKRMYKIDFEIKDKED